MSIAFTVTKRGVCKDYTPLSNRWSGIENEAIQGLILNVINRSGVNVDPYDGADLSGLELEILIHSLEEGIRNFETMPDDLNFNQAEIRFFHDYSRSGNKAASPKEAVQSTLKELARLAKMAQMEGEHLVFLGD